MYMNIASLAAHLLKVGSFVFVEVNEIVAIKRWRDLERSRGTTFDLSCCLLGYMHAGTAEPVNVIFL
jgi:hypothetical protein